MASDIAQNERVNPLVARQRADKDLITFDPTMPPTDFAEALASATAAGLSEADAHVVMDAYTPLNQDKDALVDRAFVIQHVKFMEDNSGPTTTNYANAWCVRDDGALFRVTDGSTGLYAQLVALVTDRLDKGTPAPYGPFIVDNGLTKSEYGVDKNGKAVPLGDPTAERKGATYYIK